ncbi:MAG: branched-chain amino acid ABC transporter permease [Candidatus Tectimicrobiota bacterium]|nr:MAG: branched-chain amino acid ABC transporter permease [Candidatus Tectomicrobia bacterium]
MAVEQLLLNSLIRAAELGLLSLGLTLLYGLLRFANFAHVEFAVVGAYLALFFNRSWHWPLPAAALLAMGLTGSLGLAVDRLVFCRLRHAAPVMLMITSFGLGIALREGVRTLWGPAPQLYPLPLQRPWLLGPVRLTPLQLGILGAALACALLLHLLLTTTRAGMAMRATADHPELAQACGIATERVIGSVWFLGAAFAALAGVLMGAETQLHPNMGFAVIIPVFCAALLGGIGRPYGALLGALLLALAENAGLRVNFGALLPGGSWYLPTGYKDAIAFAVLILVLLLRPQGLLGGKRPR